MPPSIVVEDPGQGVFESGLMGAAVDGVDVICKRLDDLIVAGVILQRHLCGSPVFLFRKIDGLRMDRIFVQVQKLHEGTDAAFVVENFRLLVFRIPMVGEDDLDAGVQKRLLPEAGQKGVVNEVDVLKDLIIGTESDGGAGPVRIADDL